ncbi:tumor necrosis factor receptor superfamily member 1A isoform X2 [Solea solea]|uniref:tumor necrosis factor receptor superfamily member 1A isoform X2 n=1 Tax=Solea solea TaxID=90069 RepID=UPI0027295F3C|nr:tumor necrosis factor receptor superfamily member 1A isoform X2 [Solea solea]
MMEGAGINWNKKSPVGTTLLFMCLVILLALSQTEEVHTCPPDDYTIEQGICCNKCSPGFKLLEKCRATGHRSTCTPCPLGQFMDQINFSPNCRRCRRCKEAKHEYQVSPCNRVKDTECRCKDGYYRFFIDSDTYECRSCSKCGSDAKEIQRCTWEKNTVCECKENYYSVKNKCEPCKTCSPECKHHCATTLNTQNTKDPDAGQEFLISIIAGVAVLAVVLLVMVFFITHVVTKWFTKKKLLKASIQASDFAQDSSEVLIRCEENFKNNSVQAVPESLVIEQQQSKLPDCVPLEIKIADLIYTVLDLVPVLQVKQLVRLLGVKDTEIEQAQLDYRSCREAHYQMLRVWAERGSHGGGGRGGMLYMPLLQELLDKLKMMLLGGVAEELETKYGIPP